MIALALLLLQAAPAAPAPAGWTLRETSDPATGAKSTSASIRNIEIGGRLVVRCDVVQRPILSVQYIPRPALQAGANRLVTLTIDNAKAEMSNWQFPGGGGYVDDPVTVFIYAQSFAAAKTIRVETTNDAGEPIANEFAGPGSDALFRKVFEACGQPYAMPAPTPPAPSR